MLEILVSIAIIPIEVLRVRDEIPQPKACRQIGSELHRKNHIAIT
jgi:hypothetical protein